eukprot:2702165-Prymnesium_polylepis.2
MGAMPCRSVWLRAVRAHARVASPPRDRAGTAPAKPVEPTPGPKPEPNCGLMWRRAISGSTAAHQWQHNDRTSGSTAAADNGLVHTLSAATASRAARAPCAARAVQRPAAPPAI